MAECRRCGRCCRIKESVGEFYRLTADDCPFLKRLEDGKTECSIYEKRHFSGLDSGNICVPVSAALEFGDLPPDCPYALEKEGYQTKVIDWMCDVRSQGQ